MPHDWHPEGGIRHILKAELLGLKPSSQYTTSWRDRFRSRSPSPSPSNSPSRSPRRKPDKKNSKPNTPSRSPSPTSHNPLSLGLGGGQQPISFQSTSNSLPQLPTYGEAQEEVPWFEGAVYLERPIKICLNPCPDSSGHGGISSLDISVADFVEGLGSYVLIMRADPVSGEPSLARRKSVRVENREGEGVVLNRCGIG
jgi:hypothetical protein